MRVLIVNTADRGGGAERSAMRLLDGLLERGDDAWLTVGVRTTAHDRVVPIGASPHVRPTRRAAQALWDVRREVDARLGREDFAFASSRHVVGVAGAPPDVLLAVNLHGGYFDLTRLPRISREVPTVVKLADSWLFTGHCAVPPGCDGWERGCGDCPDLAIPPAIRRDRTAANLRRKRRIWERTRLTLVSPSRWMLDRARRSALAPAIERSHHVPNGIELDVFAPGPAEPGRAELDLAPDVPVLLYVANGGLDNPYKDRAAILEAARRVAARHGPVELVVVGSAARQDAVYGDLRIHQLPYVKSPRRLADIYRAADLYVHAAEQETFCMTAAEALACGTPVVAAAGGGLVEVVRDGETGLLAAPGAVDDLSRGIGELLDDRERRTAMGAAAAADAKRRFGVDRMVDAYREILQGAVERRRATPV